MTFFCVSFPDCRSAVGRQHPVAVFGAARQARAHSHRLHCWGRGGWAHDIQHAVDPAIAATGPVTSVYWPLSSAALLGATEAAAVGPPRGRSCVFVGLAGGDDRERCALHNSHASLYGAGLNDWIPK